MRARACVRACAHLPPPYRAQVEYEFPVWENIDHSWDALQANTWPARFLGSRARLNDRAFADPGAEAAALIYVWNATATFADT